MLGIPLSHVFANTILFNEDGSYSGFDPSEFPSRSGGKAEAVKHIKKVGHRCEPFARNLSLWTAPAEIGGWSAIRRFPEGLRPALAVFCCSVINRPARFGLFTSSWQAHGYQTVIMVGDGITDFEARAPGGADAFIGCVGVAHPLTGGAQLAQVLLCSSLFSSDAACLQAAEGGKRRRLPPCATCCCRYGGVVYRENVAQLSDWYVFEIPAIAAALQQAST